MSTHCSRYPECGCPKEIGIKCGYESSNRQNSELYSDILCILMRLPLKYPMGDCYDPSSAANDIENIVINFTEFLQKNYTKVKGTFVRIDVGILTFGSENYYKKIASEHGKTFIEVYQDFKNNQQPKNAK